MTLNTVSYTKPPQAGDDTYSYVESDFFDAAGNPVSVMLNVLANDLGGNAKKLYSIDDGDGALSDLLAKNTTTGWEATADGNQIRINNGQIEFKFASGFDANSLAAGESYSDSFVYAIQLGNGTLSYATVSVHIVGQNDVPVAEAAAAGVLEDAVITGHVSAADADLGQTATLTYALVDPAPTGLTFNADGSYSFDASSYDALPAGEKLVMTIAFTASDATSTSAPANLVITIEGTNDAAQLSSAVVAVTEADAPLTTTGSLTISDVDSPESFVAQSDVAGAHGKFSIDAAGNWTYTADSAFDGLNVGDALTDTFSVAAADGTLTSVQVTINGSNDAAVLSSDVVALTETDAPLTTQGLLSNSDVDNEDTFVAQTDVQGSHGKFSIASDGAWTYTADSAFDSLNVGDALIDTFSVAAADGTLTSVQVTINGSNDAAVLSSAVVELTETDAPLTTGGTLSNSDVDNEDTFVAQTDVQGSHGKFSIASDGAWTYTADSAFDSLNVGDALTDTFSVAAADGTLTSVQVTINGSADALPVLSYTLPAAPVTSSTLTGSNSGSVVDVINGTGANETINGLNGNDILNGGAGNDVINGGNGADQLTGGLGSDALNGGNQSDIFYYSNANEATDVITGFAVGSDKLSFSGAITSGGADYALLLVDTDGDSAADATLLRVDSNGAAAGGTLTDMVVLVGVTNLTAADIDWQP